MSAATAALAIAAFIAAIAHQTAANRPIGEGDLFVSDAADAAEQFATHEDPDEAVRRARNELGIEAVSLLDRNGVVIASSTASLLGRGVSNPLLAYGAGAGRFAALAAPTEEPIAIDGVVEWSSGSVLYQVISPMEPRDGFVLLHYDVSELLSRRSRPGEIQALTLQLVALGGILAVLAIAGFVGHSRAARRHREMEVESELLRSQARELAEANAELGEARRRAERALALSEEKMRIRSEFVLMINHELRTPLTSVVTGAELIRSGDLRPAEAVEVLDSMVAQGRRLNEIIDQILAVARIENRGLSHELSAIPLVDVCQEVGADSAGGDEDIGSWSVHTDVKTLALVLSSLAENARTHGASSVDLRCELEPAVSGMVEIGARPETAVYFVVADDGPGIDVDFLPRIFEKFEKNSASSGTGLGLYMVRLMVEAIDGSVAVDTSPRGTTFQVSVPAQAVDRILEPA